MERLTIAATVSALALVAFLGWNSASSVAAPSATPAVDLTAAPGSITLVPLVHKSSRVSGMEALKVGIEVRVGPRDGGDRYRERDGDYRHDGDHYRDRDDGYYRDDEHYRDRGDGYYRDDGDYGNNEGYYERDGGYSDNDGGYYYGDNAGH